MVDIVRSHILININQNDHGFSVGDIISLDISTLEYKLAIADSADNANVIGIVAYIPDTNNIGCLLQGYITGLNSLTAGILYYLSDSDEGQLTDIEPTETNHVSKPLLLADSETSGWFYNFRGITIGQTFSDNSRVFV